MAKFYIYSSQGVLKGEGCPTYTGTYMKPGVLEFREIASPNPISWAVGDYVGYVDDDTIVPAYPRTGHKYTLYNIPQVKRQSRNRTYGAAFLYQNVQFYDASQLLTLIPFRDLVPGDNRVHFSTQPQIAVFTNVAGIAERIQACLDVDYANQWNIRIATLAMGASQDVVDLMAEYRNFSVSGVTLMGVLDKIYEVWPEIGWVFSIEDGVNTITLGGAGLNLSSAQEYLYGKGNGLTSLTRTPANTDELANRIYAYGSSRNMLSGWYRSKPIKEAESVDIEHLMLPIEAVSNNPSDPNYYPGLTQPYPGWGLSDDHGTNKPDAAKAFVEDSASIIDRGLREKIVYFDGTQDTEEIYPTIRNMTIADVIAAVPAGNTYSPNTSVYTDTSVRVDRVRSVETTFDSGLSADSGKQTVLAVYDSLSRTTPITILAGDTIKRLAILTKSVTVPETGKLNLDANFAINGTIAASDATVAAWLEVYHGSTRIGKTDIEVKQDGSTWYIGNSEYVKNNIAATSMDTLTFEVWVQITASATSSNDRQYVTGVFADASIYLSRFREKTFQITLNQVGFDIAEQAALGNGKTIHFRTGKCAGRTFTIKACTYQESTDSWLLEVIRSEDESLSQWFPNADYPVRGLENAGQSDEYPGDEFVLLDIAMPDSYVAVAEMKLLVAAQEFLEWSKKDIWQYTPEIDAKFMVENARTILPAQYIILYDANLVNVDDLAGRSYFKEHNDVYYLTKYEQKILLSTGGESDAVLVDSVTINEGESTIPTYKVTLRERKRKKASGSAEVDAPSSTPVATATKTETKESTKSNQFFEEDDNGGVKLKDEYIGLWTNGFLAAAGMSSSGSATNLATVWATLTGNSGEYANVTINPAHIPIASTSAIGGVKVDGTTITISNGVISAVAGGTITSVTKGTATAGGAVTTVNGAVTIQFPTIPTNISSFINDSGYITSSALSSYLPLTGGTLTGTLNVGDSSHSANLNVYGNTILGGTMTFPNNKAIKWYNSAGTATVDVIKLNASNQVVLGAGLTMESSGNSTLSGTLTVGSSSTYKATTLYGTLAVYSDVTLAQTAALKWLWSDTAYTMANIDSSNNFVIGNTSFNVVHGGYTHTFKYSGGSTGLVINASGRMISYGGLEFTRTDSASYPSAYMDYDSTNHAFHIHGNIYADGFVSAGGIGTTNTTFVTVEGEQTISGAKTFTAATTVNASYYLTAAKLKTRYVDPSSGNYIRMANASGKFIWIGSDVETTSTYKLVVNGSARATAWDTTSDARLKDDIQSITGTDAIEKLVRLNPVSWEWNKKSQARGTSCGFVAQEVEKVIPEMVRSSGVYLSLDYTMLHAYEVSALQSHERRLKALESKMKDCHES